MRFDNLKSEQDVQVRRDILAIAAGIGLVVLFAAIIRLVILLLGLLIGHFLGGSFGPIVSVVALILGSFFIIRALAAQSTYAMIAVSFPFLVVIKVVYKISKRELLKARLAVLNFLVGFIGGIAGVLLFFPDFIHLFSSSFLWTLLATVGVGISLGFILSYIPFEAYKKD